LDKDNDQAWTNLLVSINNWALDVASEEKGKLYDFATILLDQGVSLDPTYANFRSNYIYVFYHWIHGLATLGRFDDARKVFDLANSADRIPGNKDLLSLIESVNQEEIRIKKSRGQ
jgi:pentatricopeptide repeat protein